MVQQAFNLASGMNSMHPENPDSRMSDFIPNGKPTLSAQSSLQYTDDNMSINSFFPEQQNLPKQRVSHQLLQFYFIRDFNNLGIIIHKCSHM